MGRKCVWGIKVNVSHGDFIIQLIVETMKPHQRIILIYTENYYFFIIKKSK